MVKKAESGSEKRKEGKKLNIGQKSKKRVRKSKSRSEKHKVGRQSGKQVKKVESRSEKGN